MNKHRRYKNRKYQHSTKRAINCYNQWTQIMRDEFMELFDLMRK